VEPNVRLQVLKFNRVMRFCKKVLGLTFAPNLAIIDKVLFTIFHSKRFRASAAAFLLPNAGPV
jgi:hypothetical protein